MSRFRSPYDLDRGTRPLRFDDSFVMPAPHIVMHGLVPLLSGLGFAGRAHGVDSTGFRGDRRDWDSDRCLTSQPSHRHTRTCSGYPYGRPTEAVAGDTRNKSGYDERTCLEPVEGGRPGFTGKGRITDAARSRNPRRTPVQPRPMAEPDSNGLVPGIHFRRRNGPEGDARNKSGHDRKRQDTREASG